MKNGAEWFKGLSASDEGGTKLYGASGKVKRPGLWELPLPADPLSEATIALQQLGYKPAEAQKMARAAAADGDAAEQIIRKALQSALR